MEGATPMPATPTTFAELVDGAAEAKGLNDYQLSAAIGLMPGNKVCSPKQVGRIRNGEQVNYSRELVQRLIEVLDLDPVLAWELADKWPPGLTADDVHKLGLFSGRRRRSDRTLDNLAASASVSDRGRSTTGTLETSRQAA
jgi:transcriptional regulator with XRE-family HTH domain